MSFDVLLDHLFRDIARAPCTESHCPEVIPPVALFELWELVLKESRRSPLQMLHHLTDRELGRILDVHVHMIDADCPFQDHDILRIAGLDEQFPATCLHIAFQNVVAVFCHPDEVNGETCDRMAAMSVGI